MTAMNSLMMGILLFAVPAEEAVKANNEFACTLYSALAKDSNENLFFSPVSIFTALSMTRVGARGETARQISAALQIPPDAVLSDKAVGGLMDRLVARGPGMELRATNALWGQSGYGILETFIRSVRESYNAGWNEVDFRGAPERARGTINAWVAEQTRDKIRELLKPGALNAATKLVLVNAIHFKGQWSFTFDKAKTRSSAFYLGNGQSIQTPMMHRTGRIRIMEAEGFSAVELPYAGDTVSMIVLLPEKTRGPVALEDVLTAKGLHRCRTALRSAEVDLSLPSFKTTFQTELGRVLRAMGMIDAFAPSRADFSAVTGKKDLYLSSVVHQAHVEVSEEGTEAAAATGSVLRAVAHMKKRVFHADHPFVFMICDKESGTVLFMGRITDPRS